MLKYSTKAHLLAFGISFATLFGTTPELVASAQSEKVESDTFKTRPLKKETEEALYKKIAAQARHTQKAYASPKDVITTMKPRALCASSSMLIFAKTPHFLTDVSIRGELLSLEDHSGWSIKDSDQLTASRWTESAAIAITPNDLSLWAKLTNKELRYKYRITNLQTNEHVEANLTRGPLVYGQYTTSIRRIDRYSVEIALNNGTLWRLDTSKASSSLFKKWLEGDHVITGTNNTWFGLGYSDIIINSETDTWLPAQRVY